MFKRPQTDESTEEKALRESMVRHQVSARGIDNQRVLRALLSVPRSLFCPAGMSLHEVYGDHAMSIGQGQTISQPYMVALMTALLDPREDEKILEIGTGSGYQAALLALLADSVYSVERIETLAQEARNKLRKLHLDNVHIQVGDGTLGWPQEAPYDAIMVTAAAPEIPVSLPQQLKDGGRLLVPVGDRNLQRLVLLRKQGDKMKRRLHDSCVFVPLMGEQGWPVK